MNIRLTFKNLILACGLLFVITACTTPPKGDPRITLSPEIRGFIDVLAVDVTENAGGTLSFQIALKNTTPTSVGIRYKVEWFREDGSLYQTILSTWKPATLMGREIRTLQEVAPNPAISSFRVQIRED